MPSDKPKTAFATRKGLIQFRVIPFELCSAPATFQRLMETVLAGVQWQIYLLYLDDGIVVGRTFEDMLTNLRTVFNRLKGAGLKLKPTKCRLFARQVRFLGYIVSGEGITTDPDKAKIVNEWLVPSNFTELRSFLGLCSYHRKHIQQLSATAKCLHRLTEKGRAFVWTNECQETFDKLKQRLVSSPILAHPDFTKPFILDTDASNGAICAILSQEIDGQERVTTYASRTLSKAERQYYLTRKELLAIVVLSNSFNITCTGESFS